MSKIKCKGAYLFNRAFHQNNSALVVPKAATENLINGTPIKDFILNHKDLFDFMIGVKTPRNSRLEFSKDNQVTQLAQMQRYYVSTDGGVLTKVMPPLAGKVDERRLSVESGWLTSPCNDMKNASWSNINYDYYIEQAEKLVLEFH